MKVLDRCADWWRFKTLGGYIVQFPTLASTDADTMLAWCRDMVPDQRRWEHTFFGFRFKHLSDAMMFRLAFSENAPRPIRIERGGIIHWYGTTMFSDHNSFMKELVVMVPFVCIVLPIAMMGSLVRTLCLRRNPRW